MYIEVISDMNYTYERISNERQDVRRQEISLQQFKIDKRYIDKLTGKNMDRPQLQSLMLDARTGDNIYCESVSRLGRNVDDLRKLVEYFININVTVYFVKEGFSTCGTTYKFLLTILGAVGEMERELICSRSLEGILKSKKFGTKSGKPFGRPKESYKPLPPSFKKYYTKWRAKEITAVEFAKLINVSRATLYRQLEKYEGGILK
jgi:DNA invertase Pin-like site-specific DNA recombinase